MKACLLLTFSLAISSVWGIECPDYEDIRVEISSKEMLESSSGMAVFASHKLDRTLKNHQDLPVFNYSLESFKEAGEHLLRLKDQCYRIKQISFLSHGAPGVMDFGKDALSPFDYTELLSPLKGVLSPGGYINFKGCNVGKGCLGRLFIRALSKTLMSQGGRAKMATHYEVAWGRVAPFVPINFKSLKVSFDANYNDVKFNKAGSTCQEDTNQHLSKLNEIQKNSCLVKNFSQEQKEELDYLIKGFHAWDIDFKRGQGPEAFTLEELSTLAQRYGEIDQRSTKLYSEARKIKLKKCFFKNF